MRLRADLDKVTDGGGFKALVHLFTTYFFFCKSMTYDLMYATLYVFFTNILRMSDSQSNDMTTVATAPFGIKTLWGALSDAIPCLGYHKRFYTLWGVGISIMFITVLIIGFPAGRAKGDIGDAEPAVAGVLFFGCWYGQATVDSLTQARYTELMKESGSASIVSFVWGLMQISSLISCWGNLLLPSRDNSFTDDKILLYLAIPCCLPMIIPAAANWLGDKPAKTFCTPAFAKLTQHAGIFALSMVLAFGALGGVAQLLFEVSSLWRIVYNLGLSTGFIVMSYMFLPAAIPSPALYMFLCSAMRLFFFVTLQTWYVSPNKYVTTECQAALGSEPGMNPDTCFCIPEGPSFSVGYYNLVGNLVGGIAGLAAVVIFEVFILKWNVRAAFWVTTVFQLFATMLEVLLIERWNHDWLGTQVGTSGGDLVDQIFFVVGAQAVDKIVEMLDFMPCNVLIGRLCPANLEATIFAVLAGSQNFGSQLARIFGSLFVKDAMGINFEKMDAKTVKGVEYKLWDCTNPKIDWFFGLTGLSVARVAGGIILPALTIPLTFLLLPDKGLNDDYFGNEAPATEMIDPTGAYTGQRSVSITGLNRGDSRLSAQSWVSLTQRGVGPNRGHVL